MTREEAIKHGKKQLEIFWGKNRKFVEVATRSLEAWDEVLKDVQDWQEDFNTHVKLLELTAEEKEETMMYGEDVVNIIGNHMAELKEVEEYGI